MLRSFGMYVHVIHVRVLCVTPHVLVCAHVGMSLSVSLSELVNTVYMVLIHVLQCTCVIVEVCVWSHTMYAVAKGVSHWLTLCGSLNVHTCTCMHTCTCTRIS